jgi:dihydroorotase
VKTQLRFLEFRTKDLSKKVLMLTLRIVDMNKTIEIKNENIESKCGWTPFNGDKFKGTPTHTIIAGNIKMQDGKILGDPDGTPLKFS